MRDTAARIAGAPRIFGVSELGNPESEPRSDCGRVVLLGRVPSATIDTFRTFDPSATCVSYVATVADVAGGLEK